jgi:hypothetical protein
VIALFLGAHISFIAYICAANLDISFFNPFWISSWTWDTDTRDTVTTEYTEADQVAAVATAPIANHNVYDVPRII